jgi:hypothetical protein
MNLKIEYKLTGPLSHRRTLRALEEAVASSKTFDEARVAISSIPRLETYKGGSHVAVHEDMRNRLGVIRLAIITY